MAADMKPEQVPAELVGMACKAAYGGVWAFSDERYVMTRALTAVLPEHERMVREQVAKEIETFACRGGEQCQDRFCPDCIRHDQAQRDAQIARGGA